MPHVPAWPDDPATVGEVPPYVAVPPQARQILTAAGLVTAVDEGLIRARLEELETALADIQRTVEQACATLQAALRDALRDMPAATEREACE